jgi:hypothetical protein
VSAITLVCKHCSRPIRADAKVYHAAEGSYHLECTEPPPPSSASEAELAVLKERERINEIVVRSAFESAEEFDSEEIKNALKAMAFDITLQMQGRQLPRREQPGAQVSMFPRGSAT